MSILTGRKIHSNQWQVLPFDDDVVEKVESLASSEGQPFLHDGNVVFGLSLSEPMTNEEIEESEQIEAENESNLNNGIGAGEAEMARDDVHLIPLDDEEQLENKVLDPVDQNEENVDQVSDFETDAISRSSEEHFSDDTTVSSTNGVNDSIFGKIDVLDSEIRRDIAESENILDSDSNIEEIDGIDSDADSKSAESEDVDEVEEISFETKSVRPSREAKNKGIDRLQVSFNKKSYDSKRQYQFIMREVQKCTNDNQSYIGRALKVLFTQMTAKAGIKKHGEIAIAALMK